MLPKHQQVFKAEFLSYREKRKDLCMFLSRHKNKIDQRLFELWTSSIFLSEDHDNQVGNATSEDKSLYQSCLFSTLRWKKKYTDIVINRRIVTRRRHAPGTRPFPRLHPYGDRVSFEGSRGREILVGLLWLRRSRSFFVISIQCAASSDGGRPRCALPSSLHNAGVPPARGGGRLCRSPWRCFLNLFLYSWVGVKSHLHNRGLS